MVMNILFWCGSAISLAIGLLYFRDLGDVSQMILRVKRDNMIRFIRHEYRLIGLGTGAILLMALIDPASSHSPPLRSFIF